LEFIKEPDMPKLSATYVPTGRRVTAGFEHGKANDLVKLSTKEELRSHPVSNEFLKAISELNFIRANNDTFYRGRKIELESDYPKSSIEMGPPPCKETIANRYNYDNDPVLYLSDSIFGVQKELEMRTGTLWCQKFRIPFGKLKIIDLSSLPSDSLINSIMSECEVAGNEYRCQQIFSQYIAEIIKQVSDGFIACGVRGEKENLYKNLVLFNPTDYWEDWVCKPEKPFVIN